MSDNGNQTTDSGRNVTPEPGPSNVTKETPPIRKRRRSNTKNKSDSPICLTPPSPLPPFGSGQMQEPHPRHLPYMPSTIHHHPRQ